MGLDSFFRALVEVGYRPEKHRRWTKDQRCVRKVLLLRLTSLLQLCCKVKISILNFMDLNMEGLSTEIMIAYKSGYYRVGVFGISLLELLPFLNYCLPA